VTLPEGSSPGRPPNPGFAVPSTKSTRAGMLVPELMPVGLKIVSGGQTGADRAALDFAIAHGIPHGGWCPKGRKAEDGPTHNRYELKETPSSNYAQRTEWNVRDSDGTVVFSIAAKLTGGSKKTVKLARKRRKPCLHLSARSSGETAPELLKEFIRQHGLAASPVVTSGLSGRALQAPRGDLEVSRCHAQSCGQPTKPGSWAPCPTGNWPDASAVQYERSPGVAPGWASRSSTADVKLLRERPDAQISMLLGITVGAVRHRRIRLGIPGPGSGHG
jgi:hypothetical protein